MRGVRVVVWMLCLGVPALLVAPRAWSGDEGADAERFINELYDLEFRAKVNASIDRGAQWLLKAQRGDGSWSFMTHHRQYPTGVTALATLTLLKCGVKPDHDGIQRAFAYMRAHPTRRTYSVAVTLMALDAKYAPARDPFSVEESDRYGNSKQGDPCAKVISKDDKKWMKSLVDILLEHQSAAGVWRYPGGGYDLSNTQYALLGLHAATRCGVKISKRVWLDALRYVLDAQQKTGEPVEYMANEVRGRYRFEWLERALARGFPYVHGNNHSLSMTSAGLTAIVCCQNRLWRSRAFTGALRVETQRGVRDSLAWIQQHFSVTRNVGGSGNWHYYYLYGLERCGILGRFRFVGTHDWYREGAEYLMQNQAPRGHWKTGRGSVDSCFALLFLKRATSRMDAPVITPSGGPGAAPALQSEGGTGARGDAGVPEGRLLALGHWIKRLSADDPQIAFRATIRLGAFGDRKAIGPLVVALESHGDPYVRMGAAVALSKLHACDGVRPLIDDGLSDGEDLVRHAAHQALVRITGYRGQKYLSAMNAGDRTRLRKAWSDWWRKNESVVRNRYGQ